MTIMLANTPVIETERLTLRAPCSTDWPAFDSFLASSRAAFIRSGDYGVRETWRAFGLFIGHWVMRGFGNFVFTLKGEDQPLGMAGPWFPAGWPEQEIGWTVWSGEAEGKGYAAEAATAARRFAYDTLGWTTAVSYVDPANTRSIALAERLGARLDVGAAHPAGDNPCLVYRHPAPEDRL